MPDTVIALAIQPTTDGGFTVALVTTDGRAVARSDRFTTLAGAQQHARTLHDILEPTIDLALLDQTNGERS